MTDQQRQFGFAAPRRQERFVRRTGGGAPRHGWTPSQISLAAQIAKAAGWDDDARQLVLLQLGNHAVHEDRITSTSPKLTNSDFEFYASIAERSMGGQVILKRANGTIYHKWPYHHFMHKANDHLDRMRRYALTIAQQLEATGHLEPDGAGLRGWIYSRVSQKTTDDIEQLEWGQLNALVRSLQSFARRCGVAFPQ